MEPHAFTRVIVSWPYCSKCGLIKLRNELTEFCVAKGCNYEDHPSYKNKVHKLTDPMRKR